MDEFEKNEINQNPSENPAEEPMEEPKASSGERNTNAPSGWTYSANTNQYVSWDGSTDANNAQWNPGQQQRTDTDSGFHLAAAHGTCLGDSHMQGILQLVSHDTVSLIVQSHIGGFERNHDVREVQTFHVADHIYGTFC